MAAIFLTESEFGLDTLSHDKQRGPDVEKIRSIYWHILALMPEWVSSDMSSKWWDEITYPFSNFYGWTAKVWHCISYFTPQT